MRLILDSLNCQTRHGEERRLSKGKFSSLSYLNKATSTLRRSTLEIATKSIAKTKDTAANASVPSSIKQWINYERNMPWNCSYLLDRFVQRFSKYHSSLHRAVFAMTKGHFHHWEQSHWLHHYRTTMLLAELSWVMPRMQWKIPLETRVENRWKTADLSSIKTSKLMVVCQILREIQTVLKIMINFGPNFS